MFEVACKTQKGEGATHCDDRVMVAHQVIAEDAHQASAPQMLAVLCDGVGGENFGNEAADIATHAFAELCIEGEGVITPQKLEEQALIAQWRIIKAQQSDEAHAKMATTYAGVFAAGEDVIIFNAGDSRVYRYRTPYVARLSETHTLAEELRSTGATITIETEHCITRYLGGSSWQPFLHDGRGRFFEEDVYLLFSDGITDVVDEAYMESLLKQNLSPAQICDAFVEEAVRRGAQDDVSVIVLKRAQAQPPETELA